MAEEIKNQEETKKKNKFIVIIIIAVVIILLLTFALIYLIMRENKEKENYDPVQDHMENGVLQYDPAAFVFDEDELQKQVNELYENTADGYITLSHNNQAYSSDGEKFRCRIINEIENKYDCIFNIYLDQDAETQLYLSGLIPPGSGIDNFTSQVKLDPGTYDGLLVITQVEDDHQTIHGGQLFLALHLNVS